MEKKFHVTQLKALFNEAIYRNNVILNFDNHIWDWFTYKDYVICKQDSSTNLWIRLMHQESSNKWNKKRTLVKEPIWFRVECYGVINLTFAFMKSNVYYNDSNGWYVSIDSKSVETLKIRWRSINKTFVKCPRLNIPKSFVGQWIVDVNNIRAHHYVDPRCLATQYKSASKHDEHLCPSGHNAICLFRNPPEPEREPEHKAEHNSGHLRQISRTQSFDSEWDSDSTFYTDDIDPQKHSDPGVYENMRAVQEDDTVTNNIDYSKMKSASDIFQLKAENKDQPKSPLPVPRKSRSPSQNSNSSEAPKSPVNAVARIGEKVMPKDSESSSLRSSIRAKIKKFRIYSLDSFSQVERYVEQKIESNKRFSWEPKYNEDDTTDNSINNDCDKLNDNFTDDSKDEPNKEGLEKLISASSFVYEYKPKKDTLLGTLSKEVKDTINAKKDELVDLFHLSSSQIHASLNLPETSGDKSSNNSIEDIKETSKNSSMSVSMSVSKKEPKGPKPPVAPKPKSWKSHIQSFSVPKEIEKLENISGIKTEDQLSKEKSPGSSIKKSLSFNYQGSQCEPQPTYFSRTKPGYKSLVLPKPSKESFKTFLELKTKSNDTDNNLSRTLGKTFKKLEKSLETNIKDNAKESNKNLGTNTLSDPTSSEPHADADKPKTAKSTNNPKNNSETMDINQYPSTSSAREDNTKIESLGNHGINKTPAHKHLSGSPVVTPRKNLENLNKYKIGSSSKETLDSHPNIHKTQPLNYNQGLPVSPAESIAKTNSFTITPMTEGNSNEVTFRVHVKDQKVLSVERKKSLEKTYSPKIPERDSREKMNNVKESYTHNTLTETNKSSNNPTEKVLITGVPGVSYNPNMVPGKLTKTGLYGSQVTLLESHIDAPIPYSKSRQAKFGLGQKAPVITFKK